MHLPHHNEHFIIRGMEIGSGVEAGQCLKGWRCFKLHFYLNLPSLNSLTGFNDLLYQTLHRGVFF